jgi:Fe-S cluster biosynthesis and repair protein YggX
MEEERMHKKIFTQELEGQDKKEDPGKDGEKKWKEIFKCWE